MQAALQQDVPRVLCHQHHAEMKLGQIAPKNGAVPVAAYACSQPGCTLHYERSIGYFFYPVDHNLVREAMPNVRCPYDNERMYLTEVHPQDRSYRLWRCPACQSVRQPEIGGNVDRMSPQQKQARYLELHGKVVQMTILTKDELAELMLLRQSLQQAT